ncbi:myelin-oligodendrocyte glycoprotein-like isoform X1 [Oreochromis aureus]|uniref:myelin-oligodendrocyte glycoprotein-like isoform X1 n=1 Tax=Oreochromis aureus TaxID=47969 RepID=UPI001954DB0C|nr:myelin-oligodendrocyte glycoprotein-like isoform X1 [Oreochromis aureus]
MSVYSSLGRESSSLWTFILCSALLVWTPVQAIPTSRDGTGSLFRSPEVFSSQLGEVLVIGSSLPVIAVPGDDVILPCHLEPTFNVQGLTVEWSKPDLKPDPSDRLSRVEYVHLYRDRKEVPDMKMASYFRRTELFMDAMKHGNISLKILNVSEEDNGRYRCFIPKLRSRVKAAVVELVVDPNYGKISLTETPLHPRNFQTPDPQDTTQRNAGRSRVAVLISIIIVSLLVVTAFAAYFSRHHTKEAFRGPGDPKS